MCGGPNEDENGWWFKQGKAGDLDPAAYEAKVDVDL
jgi:hypothetical protein